MAIILAAGRPALPVWHGTFAAAPAEWAQLEEYRATIEAAIAAVGLVEMVGHPYLKRFGTAFLAGPGRVLTASMVAEAFVAEIGNPFSALKSDVDVRFVTELNEDKDQGLAFSLSALRFVHPFLPVALCELDAAEVASTMAAFGKPEGLPTGLTLAAKP